MRDLHPRTVSSALLLVLVVLGSFTGAIARDLTPAERLADFDQLAAILDASYGMVEYKKQVLGVDLAQLTAEYRAKVAAVARDDEFYTLLSAYVAALKDGHLGHYRPSVMSSRLGFDVMRAEGKLVVRRVEDGFKDKLPFKPGDELVAMDGKPVATILREMLPTCSNGREDSALGFMAQLLTDRSGWFGAVPTGLCQVQVRPFGGGEAQTLTVPWVVQGKPLPGLSFFTAGKSRGRQPLYPLDPGKKRSLLFLNPVAALLAKRIGPVWAPEKARALKSSIFTASTFDSEKGRLGYIRVPTFTPDQEVAVAVDEMRSLLKKMKDTKGLILDLNNNPGGYLTYCMELAAMFMSRPLDLPTIAERASRATLTQCRSMALEFEDETEKAIMETRALEIEKAMEAGDRLTGFGYMWGQTSQPPDPKVVYTQPVVVLINDQCYSCGDIFPALMQDARRATLFGTTTAGAGGSVNNYGPLSYSGSSVSVTETIMKRTCGTFIENVGVSPDVPYEVTQSDVATDFAPYRQAYIKTLLELIK
ncbi:MAG: PDZ domain-containing protein [Candidatus Riflebacteria bacterium]|nr:PDZ domain-containing protein [Candidatus Riflebacteria bacterium]